MRTKTMRMFSLLLALVMILALAGCGQAEAPAAPAAPAATQAPAAEAAPAAETAAPAYQIKGTVELISPFKAGGTMDMICRLFQPYLEKNLEELTGQDVTVIVTNMEGSSGRIAYTDVYKESDPDAARIVLMASPTAQLFNFADEDPTFKVDEYTFVGGVYNDVHYVMINSNLEIDSFDALLAASAEQSLLYGTSGIGASEMQHGYFLSALLEKEGIDLKFDYVNYSGTGEVKAGFLANDIDISMGNTLNCTSYQEAGAAYPLAVVSTERTEKYPDVPTLVELGCPESVIATIADVLKQAYGFVGSPNMAPELASLLREAIVMCNSEELMADATTQSLNIVFTDWETQTSTALAAADTFTTYADLIKAIYNG